MRLGTMAVAAALVAAVALPAAWAEGPAAVGSVVAVSGPVEVGAEGAWQPAAPEQELFEGQTIRTGAGGAIEVLFAPDAPARVGENAEIAVADLLLKASLEQTKARLVPPVDATRADMKLTPLTGVRGTEASEEKAGDLKREHYWSEEQAPATE